MKKHIMVVDDSKTIRNLVAFVLKGEGFKVSTAEDGLDAIEKLYSLEPVDLIVSDVNMPRMDGHALARQLRDDGSLLPVIGATANATAEERERCLASGMQGYLSKPIDIARLRRAITTLRQGNPV